MRKIVLGLDEVKDKIRALKGEAVAMNINRGRKRIESVNGIIRDIYPSVFTVTIKNEKEQIQTFSYFDVMCGNVIIL